MSPLEQFENDLDDPIKAQRETLKEILTKLQSVPSLLKLGITPETSLEDFTNKHPLTDYEDYDAAINSIADGVLEPSSIIGHNDELLNFAVTSGTSRGRSKLIPWTKLELTARMRVFGMFGEIFQRNNLPPMNSGMSMTTLHQGTIIHTKSGMIGGGVSTLKLSNPTGRAMTQKTIVSPVEICLLDSNHGVVVYAHLLVGLLRREDVTKVTANYANQVLELFMTLKKRFQDGILVNHLRSGVTTVVDGVVDENSLSILQPLVGDGCTELADLVERECGKGFDGILPRLFPNCKYILTHTSGAMIPYAQKLKKFTGGDIPLLSLLYAASEGMIAVNTDPLQTGKHADYKGGPLYTLIPRCAFVELLPYPADEGQQPILLDKVQVGGEYEIIVTSLHGMLRYRLGDVVRVQAFEKKAPVLEFLYRKSAILSLSNEFMTEAHLMAAMSKAEQNCAPVSISLVDFVFDGDRDSVPPRYIVYCELEQLENEHENIMSQFVKAIDSSLTEENSYYKKKQMEGKLGSLKLIILKPGTFRNYRDVCMAQGTDPTQYKTPRCVGSKQGFRDILVSSTGAEYVNVT